MKYLFFICSDGAWTQEAIAEFERDVPAWVAEMEERNVRAFGHPLVLPKDAVTVRVRDGRHLVSDGPFAETKEFIAGFDLIECEDLDEAVEIASKHPLARFQCIEVRPFMETEGIQEREIPRAALVRGAPEGRTRYLVQMCVGDVPGKGEVGEKVMEKGLQWSMDARESGHEVYSHPLAEADTATTVRVRDGKAILTDGPFADTKEHVRGFSILDCANQKEAVDLALAHPLASYHRIEIRQFSDDE